MKLEAPGPFGPYEIVEPLGSGGMGEVYRARDPRLGREIAIKILAPDLASSAVLVGRFQQEARAASRLSHPNIVTIYDTGVIDDVPFIAMEYVEGHSLRDLVSRELPLRKALDIGAQVAEGLAAAHAKDIVHRDLKPENVVMRTDGRVAILDFGLAKQLPGSARSDDPTVPLVHAPTQPGAVVGTASYMSPEQAAGAEIDFRSDQFSLGTMLFEMVSGRLPFERRTSVETLAAIIRDDPPPLESVAHGLPAPVRWVIGRCLEKEPKARYASTLDLARDLASLRDNLSDVGIGNVGSIRPPRRVLWLALVALIAAFAAGWLSRGIRRATEPTTPIPGIVTLTASGVDTLPTVSPDGGRVAFVSSRDGTHRIWIKDMITGAEVPLTGGGDDTHPRFSPDGSSVLFIRRDEDGTGVFRVAAVGGDTRRVIDDALFADWSPDGTRVAFGRIVEEGGTRLARILVANSDGTGATAVRDLDDVNAFALRWSPDGTMLAVSYPEPAGGRVVIVPVGDGDSGVIAADDARGPISIASWSRDSRALLYVQAETVNRGSSCRVVRHPLRGDAHDLLWIPAFSLVVEQTGTDRLVLESSSYRESIVEQPTDGDAALRWLSRSNATDRQPVYTRDQNWIVFTSERGGNLDLWRISRENGTINRLTEGPAVDWDALASPDGEHLFWSSNRSGRFEIWRSAIDGSAAAQVTRGGRDAQNPSITADGKWLYYFAYQGDRGVRRVHPDGSEDQPVLSGLCVLPEISPDDRYLMCVDARPAERKNVLRIIDLETATDLIRIPFEGIDTANPFVVGRARWMPDGSAFAFLGSDGRGASGLFVQQFVPGTDTTATRQPLAGFDPERGTESFAISPDGSLVAIAEYEWTTSIVLANGVSSLDRSGS